MTRHLTIGPLLFSRTTHSSIARKPRITSQWPLNLTSPEACVHVCSETGAKKSDSYAVQKNSVRVKKNIKSMNEIPGPKGVHGLPLLGTILALEPFTNHTTSKFHLLFHELHAKYGKIVLFPLGMKKSVVLFDPDLIETVISQEGLYPRRTSLPVLDAYVSRRGVDLFSTRQGESWYRIRRPLQQGLSPQTIGSTLLDHFRCGEDLVTALGHFTTKDGQLNGVFMKRLLMQYVLEATALITFNTRLNILGRSGNFNEEHEEFLDDLDEVFRLMSKSLFTLPLVKLYRTSTYNRFESAMDKVRSFCAKKLLLAREELIGRPMCDNLLGYLSRDQNMADDEIISVMSSILFGGIEMTSQALMWVMWSLGTHEDKQERLVQEIQNISGMNNSISVETLQHMPYLKACVKESFRFVYPTVNGPMRINSDDVVLGDYLIPKDTRILFGHNTLCRSTEYFDHPEEYIPERWMDGGQTPDRRRRMTICALAFGMGRRNCVGRRLAEQQIYVAVIKILQRYKITIPETSRNPGISYSVAALPEKDLDIRFINRTIDD